MNRPNTLRKFHRLIPADTDLPLLLKPTSQVNNKRQPQSLLPYNAIHQLSLSQNSQTLMQRKTLPSQINIFDDYPEVSLSRNVEIPQKIVSKDVKVVLNVEGIPESNQDRQYLFSRQYARRSQNSYKMTKRWM